MRTRPCLLMLCTVALTAGSPAYSVVADDHFLTIGGGYSPTGNQISLEKNVLLFHRLLEEEYPGGAAHDVYFSDGDNPARDLQFESPPTEVPEVNRLLANVFQQTRYLDFAYRTHQLPNVRGDTSRTNIEQWFEEKGKKLVAGDRLFVYVTAHGGSGPDKKQPQNTKLMLWDNQQIMMDEFVTLLDKIPPDVPVVVIMVQCYAGGFANIVFTAGKSDQGASASNRSGFFATVHDRPAAGCTSDISEENYREYSSYFWEAIRGQTRTGTPITRPDYDGDGQVSLDEAHAYTLVTSSTIDVPIKTSDAYLRATSRLGDKEHADLLTSNSPYDEIVALSTTCDRVVLEQLSSELELTDPSRGDEANALAKKLTDEKAAIDGETRKKTAAMGQSASSIRRLLTNRWPELNNVWRPEVQQLLTSQSDELTAMIRQHASYAKLTDLSAEIDQLNAKKMDLDRKWAKTQRLIRTLENVVLAANLPKTASAEQQSRHAKLVLAEHCVVGAKAAERARAANPPTP